MPKKDHLPSTLTERAKVPLTGEQKLRRGKLIRVLLDLLLKYKTDTTEKDAAAVLSKQMRETIYVKLSKAHTTLQTTEYVYTLNIFEFFGHQKPYGEVAKILIGRGVCTLDDFFGLPIETIQEYCASEVETELLHFVRDLHDAYTNPPAIPQVTPLWSGLLR